MTNFEPICAEINCLTLAIYDQEQLYIKSTKKVARCQSDLKHTCNYYAVTQMELDETEHLYGIQCLAEKNIAEKYKDLEELIAHHECQIAGASAAGSAAGAVASVAALNENKKILTDLYNESCKEAQKTQTCFLHIVEYRNIMKSVVEDINKEDRELSKAIEEEKHNRALYMKLTEERNYLVNKLYM
jgi:hypothetical protein